MRQFIPGIILFGILLFIPGTNAFATTFQYDFFGTANVTDSGYELGTGAPTQLSFHGSFQLDPLTTSNNPMPVSDFKLQIDQYLFYFDQSGDLCWDFYDIAPQKRSIVGSMGFNST
ncbi:MAG: hypothetical protein GY816_24240, partial [Cytophagales bacterium]|nr:hypothetical protein [Cytophagales bacterium]